MRKPTFKKIILDDMKANGLGHIVPKIKSIRYRSFSMGDAVDVDAVDLFASERESMKQLLAKYQYGHFDGMIDLYEISNRRDDVRQAKFVHLHVTYSDVFEKAITRYLEKVWKVTDDKTCQDKMHCWLNDAVWRIKQKIESYDQLIGMVNGKFQEDF